MNVCGIMLNMILSKLHMFSAYVINKKCLKMDLDDMCAFYTYHNKVVFLE